MNVSMTSMSQSALMQSRQAPPPPPPDGAQGPQSTEDLLTSLDRDESGGLSSEEVADSPLSNFITSDNWSDVDTDGDGTISLSELQTHRESVGPPPGRDGQMTSDADAMSVIESLLSEISNSSAATETTSTYAEQLYTSMQGLLASLDA